MLPARARVPASSSSSSSSRGGVLGGVVVVRTPATGAALASAARRRRRRAYATDGRSAPAPPSSSSSPAAPSADDDEDDEGRNGWKRDPRFVRVDYSAQLAARFRRRFAEVLSTTVAGGGEARARLAEAALAVCAEDDAVAAPTTVPFPIEHWLGRVSRLADGAEAAAEAAREEHRRRRRRGAGGAGQGGKEEVEEGEHHGAGGGANKEEQEKEEEEEERAVFAAVERFLFEKEGYSPTEDSSSRRPGSRFALAAAAASSSPWWPRSALAPRRRYDHPGTAEQARRAYLHEALARRRGAHPAALAVLLADVHARLLLRGATRRPAVVGGGRRWTRAPTAAPARHLTRRAAIPAAAAEEMESEASGKADEDATRRWPLAAFPSFDPLLELLRALKRAYWPFLWDTNADSAGGGEDEGEGEGEGEAGPDAHPQPLPPKKLSHGGFVGAAKAALGEDDDAALRVVSAAAKHRLERGIFTSPGAGDLRRCLAASERVVLVLDARSATAADARAHACDLALERRDLGALLLHAGRAAEAAAELGAYGEARAAWAAPNPAAASSSSSSSPAGPLRALVGVPRPWEAAAAEGRASALSAAAAPPSERARRAATAEGRRRGGTGGGTGGSGGGWDTAFEAALADRLLVMALAALPEGAAVPPPLTVRRALLLSGEEGGDGGGGGGSIALSSAAEPQRHTW